MTTKIPAELSSTPGIADSSNATAITINSSEQVGIGTTSPAALLNLVEDNSRSTKTGNGLGQIHINGGTDLSNGDVSAITFSSNTLTKPSAIIGNKITNNGSTLFFGTSNSYVTGVTNTTMEMHPDGEVSIPNQPCLTATKGSDSTNVGHGSTLTLSFTNEYFDIGSNFDGTYFTAPEDGMYLVAVSIRCEQIEANLPYAQIYLTASNNAYYIDLQSFDDFLNQQANFIRMNGSVVVHLDAGDTCYVRFYADNLPSGSNALDIDSASQLSIIKVS